MSGFRGGSPGREHGDQRTAFRHRDHLGGGPGGGHHHGRARAHSDPGGEPPTSSRASSGGGSPAKSAPWDGWDERDVRRLIADDQLAARTSGDDGALECPICFLAYPAVNVSSCCGQPICTACYLKLRPVATFRTPDAKEKHPCPFCGAAGFHAVKDKASSSSSAGEASCRSINASPTASPTSSTVPIPIPTTPASSSKAEMTSSETMHTSPVSSSSPMSSVEDRERLEAQMRRQIDEARRRGDARAVVDAPEAV
eukprot:CAMPEP_0185707520 /NCGR_PEP_ID=MMETSP1164-20130828/24475_1 /TAXON_ID=1104430 /ORGANISM="Chrysoreinhardia sp, Strain CCMP2950" /LENGTH=254 /DNA_ID=CAMNT_0028374949 /DNA_START=199 /DNA_END=960 /DNA_ORIENTATION=+